MESDYHWLITATLVASSVIAVTANLFLLLVFCRRRGLRTVPNRFVINLLVTNLLSSILLIPLLLTDHGLSRSAVSNSSSTEIVEKIFIEEKIVSRFDLHSEDQREDFHIFKTTENRPIEDDNKDTNDRNKLLLCYFAQSSTSFVCTASIFSILLIGINQYFGVIHSLRYHFYINKCRSTFYIVTSWVVSLLCSVLGSLTYSDSSVWNFCNETRQSSEPMRILNTVYAFSYFIIVILAPFAAICLIYVCIYNAAHKNSERMRKSTSSNANLDYMAVSNDQVQRTSLPKVQSAPNFSHLVKQSTFIDLEDSGSSVKVQRTCSDRNSHNFISTLRHKISNASVFKYREETRAAKISILVIFMVLICYIPYGVTLILNCDYIRIKPGQIFNSLSLVLLVFSNMISPFLFGYRNKRTKREIGRMFGFVQTSQQNKISFVDRKKTTMMVRNRSLDEIHETYDQTIINEPFLSDACVIPEVVVTCKPENERKSILKKYTSSWTSYKKCNFITVPDSCISGDARGSFSSASTQISSEE